MSNVAPHSKLKFDPMVHILRQDTLFLPPGAHILLKWTKTLQESSAHHFVQVKALKNLLSSHDLPPQAPLFAHAKFPHSLVIDTTFRQGLKQILQQIGGSRTNTLVPPKD